LNEKLVGRKLFQKSQTTKNLVEYKIWDDILNEGMALDVKEFHYHNLFNEKKKEVK
jgi:hypothetical protein